MKALIKLGMFFCFITLLTMDSCAWLTGDKCDDTLITPREPTIYLKLSITDDSPPDINHLTTQAKSALFIGSITKFYCGGKRSGSFSFNHTLFLSKDYTKEFLKEGVFLNQPYEFKFENSEDYLEVLTSIKLYFNDGKIFESTAEVTKYYYMNIKYDVNRMDDYIILGLPYVPKWREVTSK